MRRTFWLGDVLASLVFCHLTYGGRFFGRTHKDLLFEKTPLEQALKRIFYSFNRACFAGVIAEYLIRIER